MTIQLAFSKKHFVTLVTLELLLLSVDRVLVHFESKGSGEAFATKVTFKLFYTIVNTFDVLFA